ncbi:MAG: hypothetical protein LUJ09_01380, partial [Firmicutes bacterium]|nr:hypothetical protein [Bacillota bacterium]
TTETVDATCEEDGYITYTATFIDTWTDGTEYTDTVVVTIAATGHSWDEGTITKEATATEDGEITYTCTECGETYTETIPATGDTGDTGDTGNTGDTGDTGDDDPSDTGDSFSTLWVLGLIASTMGICALVVSRKKWLAR